MNAKNIENKPNNPKLIGLMNCYLDSGEGSISGGDMAFIQIVRRINLGKKIIITPKSGEKLCLNHNLKAQFMNTSMEKKHGNIPLTWLKRTFSALVQLPKIYPNDIIYSSSDFFVDVIPSFFCKLKQPKSLWVQSIFHLISKPSEREGSYLINLVSFLLQRFSLMIIRSYSNVIIVDSPSIRDSLLNRGFPKQKIHVGYVGTDTQFLQQIKPLSPHQFDGYFIGRFHKSKGIFDLVKIWKIVVEHDPSKKLGIIGASLPETKNELQKSIEENGLENNIVLLGFLSKEQAFSHLKSGKIFLFPSHEEGFGIVILEALVCGVPTVTWELDVYKEIFHDSIIKIPKWDFKKFAEQCIRIFDDESFANLMKNKGKKISVKYDWEYLAQKDMEFINKFLKENYKIM